jgi:predicted permease
MHSLFSAFVPIWALTAIGYLVARGGALGPDAGAVLGRFVFLVAMPAALLNTLSKAPVRQLASAPIVAFAIGTVVTCLLGLVASRRLFGRAPADQVIGGMLAGYVNSSNLGIPVASQVLGDASIPAAVVLFQILTITPIILTLLDAGTRRSARPRLVSAVLLPVRNPIIAASAFGVVLSAAHWRLPAPVANSCGLLGAAAVPTALIALGMSLHGRHPPGDGAEEPGARAELAVAVVLKTLIQPVLGYVVGRWALGLSPHDLLAVVLCSALPTAQNAFIYAREYGLRTALARDALVVSTLLSMATLSLIAWLLGTGR